MTKIFLVRLNEFKDDEWKFISGGIQKGEDTKKALFRELNEELNLGADKF